MLVLMTYGQFYLLRGADLSVLHEGQDSRDWITDIKWSPDGSTLAIASQDSKVYVYQITNTGVLAAKLISKCEMSNSPVMHIDFDATGAYILTNDTQQELLFCKCNCINFIDGNAQATRFDLSAAEGGPIARRVSCALLTWALHSFCLH